MREATATYGGDSNDFHYHASPINITGSGLGADELKALIDSALEEEREKMEEFFERFLEAKKAREELLSNA
jgi:hypothetical protein